MAVYSQEDRLSLHRFKADEAYLIGQGKGPVQAYLDVDGIVALANEKEVDAIHPGYGFLSENPALPKACKRPASSLSAPARNCWSCWATRPPLAAWPKRPASPSCPGPRTRSPIQRKRIASRRRSASRSSSRRRSAAADAACASSTRAEDLARTLEEARREAGAAFGNDAVFLERYIRRAKHIEVQILGDRHGNIVHLYERDCSVQRRHQKVVEVAPAVDLARASATRLADAAVAARRARPDYYNAGTVEFLVDVDTGEWFFIEVNPRVQVEHTVTEMVTGIDIVRSQIQVAQGHELHGPEMRPSAAGRDSAARLRAAVPRHDRRSREQLHARITASIHTYRSPAGFGIRLDGGIGVRRRGHHAVITIRCW